MDDIKSSRCLMPLSDYVAAPERCIDAASVVSRESEVIAACFHLSQAVTPWVMMADQGHYPSL